VRVQTDGRLSLEQRVEREVEKVTLRVEREMELVRVVFVIYACSCDC
jgi:hypothetical protein